MVRRREESEEFGGYFVINGNEKLVRLLVVAKRNYPMAIERPSFVNRGSRYTRYGIQIRSVRPDQTSQSNTLHYLDDGNIYFRFSWRKSEYLVPVMMVLKALVDTNDREIFEGIAGKAGSKGFEDKQFVIDRVETLLRSYKAYGMRGISKIRSYLGSRFRPALNVPDSISDEEAGIEFLRKIVLPHLGSSNVTDAQDADKFKMLLFMIRKLYALVQGECAVDNPDAASNQEILLPGSLYGMIIKEKLEEWLYAIRTSLIDYGRGNNWPSIADPGFMKEQYTKILRKTDEDIGKMLDYFVATGNLSSPTGLDLQQTSGFTVVAEKLNFYRFVSHFRCVHRGSFFAQLKTTTVRKLLPESWGFLCPVHTPDGAPCGLLNHLAHKCRIATKQLDTSTIPSLVAGLGTTDVQQAALKESVTVQLDGRILGYCTAKQARVIHDTLRYWKVEGSHGVPIELEIGYVPVSNGGQYPGIYMYSHPSRMYRPVKYLPLNRNDFVGPFEQPFMSIACTEPEILSGDSTHVEYDPTNILSIVANMTPFSDFNQSPRNMYQCQMGKQTMGTPGTTLTFRGDNKAYMLTTGQTPVVRPPLHNAYGLDNFPNGTNAVVAVISYTGYDMDDAMIINKSSHERGFGHGSIYKTKIIDLQTEGKGQNPPNRAKHASAITALFGVPEGGVVRGPAENYIGTDGFARPGTPLGEGSPFAASHKVSWDPATHTLKPADANTVLHRYKDPEPAFVHSIRLLGDETGNIPATALAITLRIPRSPVIGDKFSSRHGQKGVLSQKWAAADLPWSESGIVPDVIINPHAFPSRMTIGMFVESLAGKAGALHGLAQDSTPWRFEDAKGHTAHEYFGQQLKEAGYNYFGNEPMYSGITGEELAADIYMGIVYYQRLRHMVNDKYQVRTTGPVNAVTGQPVKGRSKGGGIRIGEMERDALLAHGTAFLLQDRLMNCSDYCKAYVCRECGKMMSVAPAVSSFGASGTVVRCRRCAVRVSDRLLVRLSLMLTYEQAEANTPNSEVWEDGDGIRYTGGADTTIVPVPGVLKYLDIELAAMGVAMRFKVAP